KEGQTMYLELVTCRHLLGRLKRFDRFAVVLESEGKEILIYKHAIATISAAPPASSRPPAPEPQPLALAPADRPYLIDPFEGFPGSAPRDPLNAAWRDL